MSPLAAPFATFLFFAGFAAAQSSTVVCKLGYAWMLNSFDQNPCDVAAALIATCNAMSYTVIPLPPGTSYGGPYANDNSYYKSCTCSTVTYSLLSACGACQGGTWLSWSEYSINCTTTPAPASFPNPVPLGVRVPRWALIDVTSEDNWDSNKSYAVGDLPEPTPGAILGPFATVPLSSISSASSTVKPASGASSPTQTSSSNTAVIIGAAVGGTVVISLVILICFFLRRRRPEAPVHVAPPVLGASQPPMDEIQRPLTMYNGYTTSSTSTPGTNRTSIPGTPVATMRNDPNHPSTFPEYQGVPQTPAMPQGTVPSYNTTGNTLATTQTSLQQGYHGFPTV